MNKYLAIISSGSGIALGFIFDLSIIFSELAITQKDYLIYALSLCIVSDVVAREVLRNGLMPICAKEGGEVKVGPVLIGWAVALALVLSLLGLYPSLYSGSSFVVFLSSFFCFLINSFANYQYLRLILRGKFFWANVKHPLQYVVLVLVFYSYGMDDNASLYIAWLIGSVLYFSVFMLTLQKCDKVIERESVNELILPAFANVGIGQGFRLLERSALLALPSGALSVYYLAFRIFASLQQIVAVNVVSFEVKNISQGGIEGVLNRYRGIYFGLNSLLVSIAIVFCLFVAKFDVAKYLQMLGLGGGLDQSFYISFALLIFLFSLMLYPQMMLPKYIAYFYSKGKGWVWVRHMLVVVAASSGLLIILVRFGVYAVAVCAGVMVFGNYLAARKVAKSC